MKRFVSIVLVISTLVFMLAGCGGNIYFDGKYDSEKYALNSDINDVRFLIPVEYNSIKQTQNEINKQLESIKSEDEKVNYIKDRVTYVTNGTDFQIIKPAEFYLYVLNLNGIKNIEKLTELTSLPKSFGISDFMSFENADVKKYDCATKNGCTRATFSAKINDLTMQTQYSGYVSMIEDTENNKVFAIIVGYGDGKNNDTAKEIAENFYLADK